MYVDLEPTITPTKSTTEARRIASADNRPIHGWLVLLVGNSDASSDLNAESWIWKRS
jgi:hypothetical protein